MAEESQDESSKTEEPTQRKLDEARKKGQIPASREVNHLFMLLAFTFVVVGLGPSLLEQAGSILAPFITQPDMLEVSGLAFEDQMKELMTNVAILLVLPMFLFILAAFAPSVVQNKFVVSTEHIKPKFEKISPMAGLKRLLGMRAIIEFIKNLLKISIVGIACVLAILPFTDHFAVLLNSGLKEALHFARMLVLRMLITVTCIIFLLAIVDFIYQRFMMLKQMRMTKQEVKDEYKQQEGDPHVKAKVKQLRRDRARKRMMANVPKADVIITNPTHYAIALEYDPATMKAPKLTAKGVDLVAKRIREAAEKHKVPIIRNPPLARILYDTTDIDEEVPYEHYQAVAKIIGYVYKLKGKQPKKRDDKSANPFQNVKMKKK
ncbi:MAG: flagellar biosynthesis protein FlhB [Alphaproteobacteria bacterium]|nr:flagellar biosynthesis protein FlhB [Alphaproteobacteria bacterium]